MKVSKEQKSRAARYSQNHTLLKYFHNTCIAKNHNALGFESETDHLEQLWDFHLYPKQLPFAIYIKANIQANKVDKNI